MEKYEVKMLPKAHRDVDDIFDYIANELIEPKTAEGSDCLINSSITSIIISDIKLDGGSCGIYQSTYGKRCQ